MTSRETIKKAYEGWEEDDEPSNICGNCLKQSSHLNRVRYDHWTGRNLCRECEPHPMNAHGKRSCAGARRKCAWHHR